MQQITKRLTSFVWYAAPLLLSSSFAWKGRIVNLRVINPAGAGYVSYDPTRPANSLTTLATGAVVTLDAKGITAGTASTYFDVDNGAAPTGSGASVPPDTIEYTVPAGTNATQVMQAGVLSLRAVLTQSAPSANVSLVEYQINGGAYGTLDAANAAIAAQPAADFAADGKGSTLQLRITRTDTALATTILTATY